MKLSQSSLALLEDTLKKAIGKYTCGCEQTIVTDIHLQPNQNSGDMKNEGKFDKLTILKPFSFVLVDDDRETIAELLLMDDDTLLVNEELLKGLDEELDSFLKELLEK